MNRTRLKLLLVKHEGERLKPYTDTTGNLTIGVGRDLTSLGISHDEAALMLDNDISRVWNELSSAFGFFGSLDETRQHVLMDMTFNLGLSRMHLFAKMLAAIEARNFDAAAEEMLASKWAREVGDRAVELAKMMRQG
jgi:lysozyme